MSTKEDTFAALYGLKRIRNKEEGDLMPMEEFRLGAISYTFINDDGIGYWATENYYLSPWMADLDGVKRHLWADPSHFLNENFRPPHWATHVLWYNK